MLLCFPKISSILQVLRSLDHFYKYFKAHPLAKNRKWSIFVRLVNFQIASRLTPYPYLMPLIGNIHHLVKREWYSTRSNYIFGLYDFNEMGFLLHFLRRQDTFVEIGANTGIYSLLASGIIGAKSIAIEPVQDTYRILQNNIKLNNLQNLISPINTSIGAAKGKVILKKGETILSHYISTTKEDNGNEVDMETIDSICGHINPSLLLIDVVRHAHAVLKGAEKTLQKKSLKAVLIRDVNLTSENGFDPNEIHNILKGAGYSLFEYSPTTRAIKQKEFHINAFHIYLKDIDSVESRVQTAPLFNIFGKNF